MQTDLSKPAVTVLGLGAMGTALAEALLAAGHPTTVWNRSAAKAEPLAAKGATVAATPAEAIAVNRLVVVCLLDYQSVYDVLGADLGPSFGRVLVNLTSGTPAQAREFAAWAAERGADYLDGGIMAVPPMIGSPSSFLLYSGSHGAFEDYRAVLDNFGESRYLGADAGKAAVYDFALLSGMYGMFMGILHSFALIHAEGIEVQSFAPMLNRWLSGMAEFTSGAAEQIDKGDYSLNVVSSLGMQATAYDELLEFASDQGISPELLAPLGPLMARRVADGHGHENVTGVIELLKIKK
ncbi:NAD(P)-dependent oxidoreductase [Amycolatopsis nigrescens]|uniref:NAD(P)-dependent oxidoreductase n=1 Tax=Amycolatopsis nigrescens TaxID=381445 RepID=UPI00058FEEA0|nr:NAD(P)-binding domain-containing protein [Amycolatopsis nigrescens]